MPSATRIRALRGSRQVISADSEYASRWQRDWCFVDEFSDVERGVRLFSGASGRGLDVSGKDSQSEIHDLLSSIKYSYFVRYYPPSVHIALDAWSPDVSQINWLTSVPVKASGISSELSEPRFRFVGKVSLEVDGDESEGLARDPLAQELLGLDPENDWPRLRELILSAEDFGFTAEQSAQLAPRLLDLAIQYRDSNDPQDAPAVFSAIRTGASMLRPNEVVALLALLEPGHSIDTSLVALKMLGRVFEAQPSEKPDQYADLACEVRKIADSLLNPYAIAFSQSAAMAQLAVYALAAMASSETLGVVQSVRRIGVSWFTRQTARELRELRSYWDERSSPVAPDVLELLERATQELRTT